MSELRECPFCGGEAEIIENRFLGNHESKSLTMFFGVRCKNCLVNYPVIYKTKETAVKEWNRRVGDDLMERMVDDGK